VPCMALQAHADELDPGTRSAISADAGAQRGKLDAFRAVAGTFSG
jgi:hypothetical protein